ncbi:MAG TPA: class 1 fructose-bisphosphatase [Methylovirgula sp.]|nr:class 1 fructose-bisphosphatase [Methylovirgula sp.]
MLEIAPARDLGNILKEQVGRAAALAPVAEVVREIAKAAMDMADIISLGRLGEEGHAEVGHLNPDGDVQKRLDLSANSLFLNALQRAPVNVALSEELEEPLLLDPTAPLAVAIDPLDGSSNIDANVSIGTIFSILPALPDASNARAHFLQPGHNQLAAGFIIYGPQTSLVLALPERTSIFILDRRNGVFREAVEAVQIPRDSKEYAINASNYRHWTPSVRTFVDDCVKGTEGPLGCDHNMRWIASLVAEAYRILSRGGVFLYPGDLRQGYSSGRLRLIYEANPIAFIIEQAGGIANDSVRRILDIVPSDIHVRTPFVFGSANVVHLITRYHTDPQFSAEHSPLFTRRGLMRY